jgi:hypothetical protein
MGLFDRIRETTAEVATRARHVQIVPEQLEALVPRLLEWEVSAGAVDPAQHEHGSEADTLAYVVTLDAVNFGSGWFPHLKKRPGCSGYFTVAGAMKDHFAARGAWNAEELTELTPDRCATVFEQEAPSESGENTEEPIAELMELFAQALNDLGQLLLSEYFGSFEALVESAKGSAEDLANRLREMPFYRDESSYEELEVPLYKRAQLTASDLATAFEGKSYGRFDDLHELTIFADNLVPHVLRREGVLTYTEELAARIDREEALEAGSMEEVEIRAVAVHAVERMTEAARAQGHDVTSSRLDTLLWQRGHRPDMKEHPRHRARSVYY